MKVMSLLLHVTARSRSEKFMSEEAERHRAKRGKFWPDIYVERRKIAQNWSKTHQMVVQYKYQSQHCQQVTQSNTIYSLSSGSFVKTMLEPDLQSLRYKETGKMCLSRHQKTFGMNGFRLSRSTGRTCERRRRGRQRIEGRMFSVHRAPFL